MPRSALPASARKFLRREKARIRRGVFDVAEAEQCMDDLVQKTFALYNKGKVSVYQKTSAEN